MTESWRRSDWFSAGRPDVFVARGTNSNQGLTFGQRINLSESGPTDSRDERIAVTRSGDNLRIYVVWIEDAATLRFRGT